MSGSGLLGLTSMELGLATTGLSLAGQVFGAVKQAKENHKNQELLNTQVEQNKAEYDTEANQSFLDTNVAKDAVRVAKENLVDNQKAVAGRTAITGASDEANIAAQTGVQKKYNDSVSRIASLGTDYKERAKNRFMATRMGLHNRQAQLNSQKAEGAANLTENAGNLLGTLTMTEGMKDQPVKKLQTTGGITTNYE